MKKLIELTHCLFYFIEIKFIMLKDLNLKDISYQKVLSKIKVIINGHNFYDQAIDSDINLYKEIRKLTTGQGEDYTAGFC